MHAPTNCIAYAISNADLQHMQAAQKTLIGLKAIHALLFTHTFTSM